MERIKVLQNEIEDLRKILYEKELELDILKNEHSLIHQTSLINRNQNKVKNTPRIHYGHQLPSWAIVRYSRQILLSDIGVAGQGRLCDGRVLIVGAGGLGCPAALYLAGAGIGEIGLIDYDRVDITNIHRQVLHYERDEHTNKVDSAAQKLRSINSNIKITPYHVQLDSKNAQEIASRYDLVLDCSDNVPTRYLLNDLCVFSKIPLISGSALKMEGQLTVYGYIAARNNSEKDPSYIGPCYRCLFPTPPPAEAVGSCSANGVAGPVPGVIGSLQALEAIKLLVGHTRDKLLVERLLLFDGEDVTFRTVKLRGRNPQCAVCSETPTITRLIDYEVFCKAQAKEKDLDLHILPPSNRITASQLSHKLTNPACKQRHLLVDVRSEAEFNMCKIDGSINYPIDSLREDKFKRLLDQIKKNSREVIFICRRGNDSQIAAKKFLDVIGNVCPPKIFDVVGGLHAWAAVDNDFPVY